MLKNRIRQHTLVAPGPDLDWEVWASGAPGGGEALRLVQKAVDPASGAASSGSRAIVAVPICESLTFAFWLVQAEASLYEPMILSQLEKRGLASRGGMETVFDYAVLAQEEGRVLVRVTLLPRSFPAALSFPKAQRYIVSADILPLPENGITLWRERGSLVLAATRGPELVYTQVLDRSAGSSPAQIALEIASIRLALELEQVVESIKRVTLWGEFPEWSGAEVAQPDWELLRLPVEMVAAVPAPSVSHIKVASERSRLLPLPLQEAQRVRLERNRLIRFGTIAAGGYVAFVFLLWAYLHFLQNKGVRMEAALTRDKPVASALERTAASWRAIEPAVNPNLYAIEQYYQCSSALPEVGIRLSSFEARGPVIRIRGTGRSAMEIYKYLKNLRKNRSLANYRWTVAQPKLKQDDTADFQIEGKLTYGSSK